MPSTVDVYGLALEIGWRLIPGFPKYRVSEYGHIHNAATGRLLRWGRNGNGRYPAVCLYDGPNRREHRMVHRLVAELFLPPAPDGMIEVNHIDGNKDNAHHTNLEWVTRRGNVKHAVRSGLMSKLGDTDVAQAKSMRAGGTPVLDIAKHFGVHVTTIYRATDWDHWAGGASSTIHSSIPVHRLKAV